MTTSLWCIPSPLRHTGDMDSEVDDDRNVEARYGDACVETTIRAGQREAKAAVGVRAGRKDDGGRDTEYRAATSFYVGHTPDMDAELDDGRNIEEGCRDGSYLSS